MSTPLCRLVCRLLFLARDPTIGQGEDLNEGPHPSVGLPQLQKVVVAMALAILAEIPDLTREQYELVVQKVNESGSPAGALIHAAGPIEHGYRIVEVWETREAADAFYSSELYREAAGASPTEPKIIMTWPVYGVDQGSGWRPIA